MSSKVTKTLSFVRPADIIQMAREKKLEKFGFAPLPQQTEWVFGESFPTESFFLRGAAAKVVYQWSPELMEFYNDGDCVVEDLIKKYNCGGLMANDGNDFDLPGSRILSFEFTAGSSNVMFPKHPNLAITSVASIAKLGEWCTVGHISCCCAQLPRCCYISCLDVVALKCGSFATTSRPAWTCSTRKPFRSCGILFSMTSVVIRLARVV